MPVLFYIAAVMMSVASYTTQHITVMVVCVVVAAYMVFSTEVETALSKMVDIVQNAVRRTDP